MFLYKTNEYRKKKLYLAKWNINLFIKINILVNILG